VIAVFTKDVADTKAKEATDMGKQNGYPLHFTTEPEEQERHRKNAGWTSTARSRSTANASTILWTSTCGPEGTSSPPWDGQGSNPRVHQEPSAFACRALFSSLRKIGLGDRLPVGVLYATLRLRG
jgi:hypothetical protein